MALTKVDSADLILNTISDELLLKYPILKYFKYDHLPEKLMPKSRPFYELANKMAISSLVPGFSDHAELVSGLRKLLEAKDCYIRSSL